MEIRKYPELKAAGTITLAKLKDGYTATTRRFSPDFGSPVPDLVEALDIEAIKSFALDLKLAKEAVDMLVTDLKAISQP